MTREEIIQLVQETFFADTDWVNVGKAGFTPKNEWQNNVSYEELDVVQYEGSLYIALEDNSNKNPAEYEDTVWMLAAEHGQFTAQQLEDFKAEVVAESKEEMDDYTDDKKDELNTYTNTKETELNAYTTALKNTFDTNASDKTDAFDSNASTKTTAFDNNATSKTTAFNTNATNKTTDFNDNATAKTTAFDTNATNNTNAFDDNASDKTDDFNDNATAKTTAFNNNATTKTTAFNTNATNKTNTFNSNVQNKTNEALSILDSEIARITDGQIEIDPNAEIIQARHGFTNLNQAVERKVFYFPNISEMKSCTPLSVGDAVRTLGYYSANDGGGACYIIRVKTNSDVADDAIVVELQNNLVADLIVENERVTICQLGYKANDATQDCHGAADKYRTLCNRDNKKYELFFPSGNWYFSETDWYFKNTTSGARYGVNLRGVYGTADTATIILPFANNQKYVWNLGTAYESSRIVGGNILEEFQFSTGNIDFCETALLLTCCCYSHFDKLLFYGFKGSAITVQTGFENWFGHLEFRGVGYISKDFDYPRIIL